MSEWKPIETAPKDRVIMLFAPNGAYVQVSQGYWDADCFVMLSDDMEKVWCEDSPTHWMQLPDPPHT